MLLCCLLERLSMNNSSTIFWSIIMYNVNNAISTGEPPIGDYTSCKDRWGRGRESGRDPQLNLWENFPAKQPIVQWVLPWPSLCCFAPYLTPCNYLWWRERLWRFLLNGIFAMLKPHCQCFLTKCICVFIILLGLATYKSISRCAFPRPSSVKAYICIGR